MPTLTPLVDGDIAVYSIAFGTRPPDFLMMVDGIEGFLDWIQGLFDTEPQVFLTGEGNFRIARAKIAPYKGNRAKSAKPPYHKDLREYLINFRKAKVSVGCEADDLLASNQTTETVIVSIDKDLDTVPGNRFNPRKNEFYVVSEYQAWFNFYVQMLRGDAADNVMGIDGIGEAKAPKLLMDKTVAEMDTTVRRLYEKQYGPMGQEAFDETYDLLYLRRDFKDKYL